jgi:hypothetical protein
VIKEEPSDIETFYIKWEMSEEGIGEEREGLGLIHILGKEYEAQQTGGTPTRQGAELTLLLVARVDMSMGRDRPGI